MKYEVVKAESFSPVSVTITLETKGELNAFTALVCYSYAASAAILNAKGDEYPGITAADIDQLFTCQMLDDLDDAGAWRK
jgi:hypothetical protein